MTIEFRQQKTIDEHLEAAATICREALVRPEFGALAIGPKGAPANADAWFDLLKGYPENPANVMAIRKLISEAPAEAAGVSVEQYAVLQALTVAASRIRTLPLPNSVKRLFAVMCREVAVPTNAWRRHFHEDLIDQARLKVSEEGKCFRDLAWLATLRRYPAGDYVFDYFPVVPRTWLLKVRPLAAPGFLYKLLVECGGWGPTVAPHINSGRQNQLFLRREEFERSLWRIAKTLEFRPDVRALTTNSWLQSAVTAEQFPHLVWFRSFFLEEGAYVIDMEPAPGDAGFRTGSVKRKQMHDDGAFFPRDTLVVWPRQDMLAWAARHPELADPGEEPPQAPKSSGWRFRVKSPVPSKPAKHNSPLHLWSGVDMLAFRPMRYVLYVLLLPALAAALTASLAVTWWAAAPAFAAGLAAAWCFQYYFFQ
jgi:hypothetical protein